MAVEAIRCKAVVLVWLVHCLLTSPRLGALRWWLLKLSVLKLCSGLASSLFVEVYSTWSSTLVAVEAIRSKAVILVWLVHRLLTSPRLGALR